MANFKYRVRKLTRRNYRVPVEAFRGGLNTYLRGWAGYFARFSDGHLLFEELDAWICRRIRQWLWVGWKTPAQRYRKLKKGGVSEAHSRTTIWCPSYWRAADSKAMKICVTNARIRAKGFVLLAEHHQRFASL